MKGDEVYREHILDAIALIKRYTDGVSYDVFSDDPEKQDAVLRRLEIIGEAAKNLSEGARDRYSGVPWPDIMGMRDVLVHRYFGVDLEAVWDTVQNDLPALEKALEG